MKVYTLLCTSPIVTINLVGVYLSVKDAEQAVYGIVWVDSADYEDNVIRRSVEQYGPNEYVIQEWEV